jgi:small subunit ribosomal protein S6
MKYYETVYLINPNLPDEDYQGVINKYNDVIEKGKGVLVSIDEWGKRSLAYPVKSFDKAYYVLLQFCGQSGLWEEFKREMTLDERVLKYLTVKLSDEADPEALRAQAAEARATTKEESESADEAEPSEGENQAGR